MAGPLEGVQAKLDRSLEHLDLLVDEVRVFNQGAPYDTPAAAKGEWLIARFHIAHQPPARLGILAGDYAQNLRAALDYLVYEIARLTANSPRGTGFPIATSEAEYLKPGSRGEASLRDRMLFGIPEKHRTIIDEVQPYLQDPKSIERDPLNLLRMFSNADKHRLIQAAFGDLVSVKAEPDQDRNAEVVIRVPDPLPILTQGVEVYRVRAHRPDDSNVRVKVLLNYTMAFGKHRLNDGDFRNIHAYVGKIIDLHRPLFRP